VRARRPATASQFETMNSQTEKPPLRHVAIIMDGNGRWAQSRGLPRIEGHRAGAEAVRRVLEACRDLQIRYLTLYAFSTENWKRPAAEVRELMRLLQSFLDRPLADLTRHGIRFHAIGELDRLPANVRRALDRAAAATRDAEQGVLTLAISYGSRAEITAAARRLAERARDGELDPAAISEDTVAAHLYTAAVDVPDPDLVIRTANEMRLSNFLLWQASYAELWVTPTLWPDFGADELRAATAEYERRQRRFGGLQDA